LRRTIFDPTLNLRSQCSRYSMRLIFVLLILTIVGVGQTSPKRIPPDEAAKHLIDKPSATYPPLAQMARIQGNIILEISINEFGAASVRRLVTGHPMLAPSAIQSVSRWKYHPFEINGKPSAVVTLVMVTFGSPGKANDGAARAEILFQDNFWTAEESAQAALENTDYTSADQQLNKARDLLIPVTDSGRHEFERWHWIISRGRLAMAQQKYDVAEQYYRKAEQIGQSGDKQPPEMAIILGDLGRLFEEEKRYDLAYDYATRSIAVYEQNFNKASSDHLTEREVYGRAIAYQSWMLSKIASLQNDQAETSKHCRTVLDFQTFLKTADHDSFVATCQQATLNP